MLKCSVKRFKSLSRVILFAGCFLVLSFARGNIGIYDGKEAAEGQFPWFVAIGSSKESIKEDWPFCGGVLVASQWVLTAQHCLIGKNPIDLKVIVNSVNLTSLSSNVRVVPVDEIYRYDESKKDVRSLQVDLALLHLSFPVTNIEPIPLLDHPPPVGEELITMGYGSTDPTSMVRPVTLQYAEVRVINDSFCATLSIFIPLRQLCTLPVRYAHPLKGDSGGPLIQLKNRTYYLTGINSYIRLSKKENSFYSSISFPEHYNWISRKIKTP